MKKIFFTIIVLFLFVIQVEALSYAGCDFEDVSRMKQIVSNINISYDYKIINDEAYFDVTISNLTNDIYVSDNYYKKDYFNNSELTIYNVKEKSIYLKFYSNNSDCKGILLGNQYRQFPIYNKYFDDEVCNGMGDFLYCNKWLNKEYTEEEIKEAVEAYKNSLKEDEIPTEAIYNKTLFDKIVEFYVKYYYIVLLGIIVLCITIIVVNKRKNQFKI